MARHFLNLDAQTVRTPCFAAAQRNVRDLVELEAMGLFYGEAGLGKTYAVETALEGVELDVSRLRFPLRTTTKGLVSSLLDLVTGVPHEGTQTRLEPLLLEALGERPRVVAVDEAQHLNLPCVEQLRHLHDHPDTRFSLLLVGGNGCYELIQRYPMLSSRIARWTKFVPLAIDEVLRFLPEWHRLYKRTDPELIEAVDDRYAMGNLREWAGFTEAAQRLAADEGADSLTEPIVEAALYLVQGESVAA